MNETTSELTLAARDLPDGLMHSVGCDQQGRDEAWRVKDGDGLLIAEFRNKAAYDFFCVALEQAKRG